ncbi:MAG: tetratricopeptide (TPR) repeat protein [Polyangiales bacterium]|jgi:tetratricopeptide (TPR) repeat protein
MMRYVFAYTLTVSAMLCSLPVQSQDTLDPVVSPETRSDQESGEAEARSHFAAGFSYFQEARYDDALTEFGRAYELSSRPALLFNMSQCYERLGRLDEAIRYLEQFITSNPPPADRAFQERRLANLRARQQGTGTPDIEEPGELIAPDSVRDVASTPGVTTESPMEPAELTPDRLGIAAPHSLSHRPLAYAFLGIGAAGLITMGVAGGLALSEKSRLQDDCVAGCEESETTSLRTRALVADIGLGLGIAGAAIGLILLLTSDDDDNDASAQVVPSIGPNAAGATLHLRY